MKNKSIYFIYEAVNCTPNGDPDTSEQRYNETTQKAIVSDLRQKRFARDNMNKIGIPVYYFYDKKSIIVGDKKVSGAAARFNYYCNTNNITIDKETDIKEIICREFIDVRVFGGVLTSKENNTHVTGALQFNAETETINTVLHGENLVNRGITTVFPSTDEKGQGSMGRDTYLRYGLFCVKGFFNATIGAKNGVTEEDLKLVLTNLWEGMKSNTSRSKYGHTPIAMIVIDHPTTKVKNGYLSRTLKNDFLPFVLKTDKDLSQIYSQMDYSFDFTPLKDEMKGKNIESLTIYCEDEKFINDHLNDLEGDVSIIDPFEELLTVINELK